jgi:hypothetical protein
MAREATAHDDQSQAVASVGSVITVLIEEELLSTTNPYITPAMTPLRRSV